MAGNDTTHRRYLHRAGVFILIAGLLATVGAHFWPPDDTGGIAGYEVVGGQSYPVMAGDSKSTNYEIERVGGKAITWEVQFDAWFSGLWRGQNLSHTLFFLSVGGALVCFGLARFLVYTPPPEPPLLKRE